MIERLTRTFAVMVRGFARVLPSERQQWVQALEAEADMVPVGSQRLSWFIGGLWLVMREGHMARKIAYWLGAGAIAAAAAWAIWMSWRTVPSADAEAMTDRVRILVGAAALLGTPWVGRSQGWFGPVSNGITARVVRLAGCAMICAAGVALVRLDSHAGTNGIGEGGFSWLREIAGIALLASTAVAPRVVRTLWPKADSEIRWAVAVMTGVAAFLVIPVQALFVLYIAAVQAATARRSPVSATALAAGTGLGLAAGGVMYWVVNIPKDDDRYAALFIFLVLPGISFLMAALSGVAAAWRASGSGSPQELRQARIRQGLFAGLMAGAAGGLLFELTFVGLGFMMVIGPLAGVCGGALGAALTADHRRQPRPDGFKAAGLFVADP